MPVRDESGRLAVVMSGGGARAAYQVGFLRCLANHFPSLRIPIVTGVSAGAINAAFLASHTQDFATKVRDLGALWEGIRVEDVFRVGTLGLFSHVVRWGFGLVSGGRGSPRRGGMVDTLPLREFLDRTLETDKGELIGVDFNLRRGNLDAVALTTSSYTTGRSVTWVQGSEIGEWERAHRVSRRCTLSVDHVMASSALPLFFPAVRIGDAWYGDGGMRLTAPLAPAVHLGAGRILAISTRYARSHAEAESRKVDGYPPPAQVAGQIMNSIFLDQFDDDALRLQRINRLIDHASEPEALGLRRIELVVLRPTRDLGQLANEYEARLPRSFRYLTRGLGTKKTSSNDFLSLVMFQHDYLKRLLELGEHDAEERRAEIGALLAPEAAAGGREPVQTPAGV